MEIAVCKPALAGGVDRAVREHAGQDRTQGTAHTVHAPGIQTVVITKAAFHLHRREIANHARRQADHQRARGIDKTGCRRDGDKPRHRARNHAQHRRFACHRPFRHRPRQRGRCGCDLRHQKRHARIGARGQGRPRVEAEPADPEQGGTRHAQHQIVRCHIVGAVTDALAQHDAGNKRRRARVQMHHGAAGIIEGAERAQKTAAPHPMGNRAIDQQQPQPHQPQEGGKFHPVGQRARDQRRRDDREGHLKGGEHRFRNGAVLRADPQRLQEQIGKPADEAVGAAAILEGEAVTDHHPQHGDEAGRGKTLRQGRQHIFLPHHAAIEQAQARNGHHQNQRGGGQHPGRVAGVEFRRCGGKGCGGKQQGGPGRGRGEAQFFDAMMVAAGPCHPMIPLNVPCLLWPAVWEHSSRTVPRCGRTLSY